MAIRLIFTILWISAGLGILIAGQWWERARGFRDQMLRQWKPSLVIALLHGLGAVIGGVGFQFSSLHVFFEAMIGLALAYRIAGFEPLPVTHAVAHKENRTEQVYLMLLTTVAVILAALFVNGLLSGVILRIFDERMSNPQEFASFLPRDPLRSFFLLLAGAGIAEETTYRLLCLSLFWRLTRHPWAAIVSSALLFGAYHLSPLDGLYLQYWERPLTIFTLSTIMGVVMGYVYVMRGFETAVLGHTLGDWIPFIISRAS